MSDRYEDIDAGRPPDWDDGRAENSTAQSKKKTPPPDVVWSPEQANALEACKDWLERAHRREAPQVFRLFGYAGTGKSTLARHIGAFEQERPSGLVQYCAFTGKAAMVMRRKGCDDARTIHSLIYRTHDKSTDNLADLEAQLEAERTKGDAADGQRVRELMEAVEAEKESVGQPGFQLKEDALTIWVDDEYSPIGRSPAGKISMFIVDECSMVDARLGRDLLSFNVPVLVLGDPAQLPPVGGGGFFTDHEPDILLTEIHRQAKGDPIVELASVVRNGGSLALGSYGESRVCLTSDLQPEDWVKADQILCGRNATRQAINNRVRVLNGIDEFLPQPGEKLVCLRNNHEAGLLNGSLWECIQSVDDPEGRSFSLHAKSLDEDDREIRIFAHKAPFLGEEVTLHERFGANEFDFGYALTVHKSQGSQWDRVFLMDEWNMNKRKEWLYTGITRAAKSITVVRKS